MQLLELVGGWSAVDKQQKEVESGDLAGWLAGWRLMMVVMMEQRN